MVGPDTCGFNGNTDEELCNRWMQLSAFFPFYRNHNVLAAIPQEAYRWSSVAEASRVAMKIRYSLLPYWYTLFYKASKTGDPTIRALFYEFPDDSSLADADHQFMVAMHSSSLLFWLKATRMSVVYFRGTNFGMTGIPMPREIHPGTLLSMLHLVIFLYTFAPEVLYLSRYYLYLLD